MFKKYLGLALMLLGCAAVAAWRPNSKLPIVAGSALGLYITLMYVDSRKVT